MPSCRSCRLTKVKCDLGACATTSCSRCARLGVECVPHVSMQGRRDLGDATARRGPAVRAAAVVHHRPAPYALPVLSVARPSLGVSVVALPIPVADASWVGWELMCARIKEAPRSSRLSFLQIIATQVKRTQSWQLASEVMSIARHFELSIDEAVALLRDAREPPPDDPRACAAPRLPDFIAEWQLHSPHAAMTRCERDGVSTHLPNASFRAIWAALHGGDLSGLDAISGAPAGDPREQAAAWFAMMETAEFCDALVTSYTSLWTAVDRSLRGAQQFERAFDAPVRMVLNGRVSGWVRPKVRCYAADYGRELYLCWMWVGLADELGLRSDGGPRALRAPSGSSGGCGLADDEGGGGGARPLERASELAAARDRPQPALDAGMMMLDRHFADSLDSIPIEQLLELVAAAAD